MMAAKPTGRRAKAADPRQRRWLPWILGIVVGLVAGGGMAAAYAPPNADVIRVEAAAWYHTMRNLVSPGFAPTTTQPWVGDPKIYATSPVSQPAENDTNQDLVADDVDQLLNVNAPMPDPEQLASTLEAATADLSLRHRMLVVDAATGQTLYDAGGHDPIVPASTLKLYTAISTLHHLDPNHRFSTAASYDPTRGVTLIGGGDGLLSNGQSTGETVGYAGLGDLATKTWEAIRHDIGQATTVTVQVDVSRYDPPFTHPTWTEGLMTGGWVSPVYPINTWGGFVTDPQLNSDAVEDGAAYAGAVFAQRLTEAATEDGYDIEFTNAGRTTDPATTAPVASVQSATLGEQLEFAMKQSNNMLFEMFGREAAIAAETNPDFTGSTATTINTLQSLGVSVDHLAFVDNSGLSPSSRATLDATIQLFELMLTNEQFRPLFQTLTIAGYDGTMRHRLAEAPYSGVVRSKTGTLEAASSNAGLTVTADGRVVWFAINTAGAEGDYATAREEQDQLAKVLSDCGCST